VDVAGAASGEHPGRRGATYLDAEGELEVLGVGRG
jgi:hypothetical protein